MTVVDTDSLIVDFAQKSINEIFDSEGERSFRDLESNVLREVSQATPKIIATGGGCVEREENRAVMKETGVTVFLDAPWGVIQDRLSGCSDRPLASRDGQWAETKALYEKRLPFYREADYSVSTEGKTPDVVAREIEKLLANRL